MIARACGKQNVLTSNVRIWLRSPSKRRHGGVPLAGTSWIPGAAHSDWFRLKTKHERE